MRYLALLLITTMTQLAFVPTKVSAVPIANLYNTGLDAVGNYQPAFAPDGNYTVVSSPLGPFTPVAVDDTVYPFPSFWVANNSPNSRWIGTSAQFSDGPNGNYLYRTTFSLPANATSAMISGLWATDDPGLDILINGNSTGQVSAGFSSLVPFSVASGFNVGLNTLDFLVANVGGGPTGLRVDGIKGTYQIPEPASLAMGFGGSLAWVLGRRRR
jgi:hypothetical protein